MYSSTKWQVRTDCMSTVPVCSTHRAFSTAVFRILALALALASSIELDCGRGRRRVAASALGLHFNGGLKIRHVPAAAQPPAHFTIEIRVYQSPNCFAPLVLCFARKGVHHAY
jgi:hypothetical protein